MFNNPALPVAYLDRRTKGWVPVRFERFADAWYARVSLWLPCLLTALPAGFLWHRHRRALRAARIGLCPHCRYSRAGLADDAACPECGKVVRA